LARKHAFSSVKAVELATDSFTRKGLCEPLRAMNAKRKKGQRRCVFFKDMKPRKISKEAVKVRTLRRRYGEIMKSKGLNQPVNIRRN